MRNSKLTCNLSTIAGFILLILSCQIGMATTIEVSEDISSNTTWDADTVLVLADISIPASYTLTINPGTYIEFQGHYKLEVHGCILASGTPEENIVFTVNDTTQLHNLDTCIGGWNGIDFLSYQADTTKLEYCILEYGKATDGLETWDNNEDYGGAIMCHFSSTPLLVSNCTIQNCVALSGAGISTHQADVIILNNVIKQNRSDYYGGLRLSYTDGLVAGNIITNNVNGSLGALCLENTNGMITNNIIVNNDSRSEHGAVYVNSASQTKSFHFFNNVIANNLSHESICGGIMSNYNNSDPPYKNNIIWGNQATGDNYQFYPDTIKHVAYNIIQGGYSGIGNFDMDPQFVNPSTGAGVEYDGLAADWSVLNYSPCFNSGKPDFTTDSIGTETDFAGNTRILFDTIDIGAFEMQGHCTVESEPDPENIILNGDFGTCEMDPWTIISAEALSMPAKYTITDEGLILMPQVLSADPQDWEIQLTQTLSSAQLELLMIDSTYELTFDACADAENRPCKVVFYLRDSPWTTFHDTDIVLNTEKEAFTYRFTMEQEYPSINVSFQIGTEMVPATFDNIRLVKIPTHPEPEGISDQDRAQTHIYPNPVIDYLFIDTEPGSILKLHNSMGVLMGMKISKSKHVRFNTNEFTNGLYFLEIIRNNTVTVHQILIQ